MKYRRAIVLGGFAGLAALRVAFANDFTVTGVGAAFCHDGTDDSTVPLVGARVQLMDSDCDGSTLCDDVMGESHVAADGTFSVTGRGGDPGGYSWSRPDVYIRVVYNDDAGVRLTDELDRGQYFDTPEHDHDNTADGATIDFGRWTTGLGVSGPSTTSFGDGTKCAVWKRAHDAFNDAVQLLGKAPPSGHYDVEYWSGIWAGTPWTNTDTTHWPIHYPTVASVHEFGHTIRHAADGDGDHFNWDVTRFRYARNHDICDSNSNRIGTDTHAMGLGFGFNEGWAEFWEGRTSGCWAVSIDDELEGNNAFGLQVLANQPFGGKKQMVATLLAHPGAIHSLDEFTTFYAAQVGQTRAAIDAIVSTVQKPPTSLAKTAEFKPMSLDAQRQAIEAEIVRMTRPVIPPAVRAAEHVTVKSSHVSPADVAKHHLPQKPSPCGKIDCQTAFQQAIAPAVADMENALRALEVSRLRESLEKESEAAVIRRLQDGSLDAYLKNLRSRDEEARLGILSRGFEQAIAAAERLPPSEETRILVGDLRTKATQLKMETSRNGRIPMTMAGQINLPEDAPVPRIGP